MIPTTAHLQIVVRHWDDLHALRTTKAGDAWPPASLNAYLRTVEEYDPADRSAPVRLHILDTIRTVETALLTCADQIASTIQRPAATRARSAGPRDHIGLRLATATLADQADPSRWHYTTHPTRTAPYAAVWLQHRLDGADGPFSPLLAMHRDLIASVAQGAAERVEHALGITRRAVPIGRQCACTGELELHGGDGRPPAVVCASCRRTVGEREAEPAA